MPFVPTVYFTSGCVLRVVFNYWHEYQQYPLPKDKQHTVVSLLDTAEKSSLPWKKKLCTQTQNLLCVKMFTEVYIIMRDTPSDGFVQIISFLTSSVSCAPIQKKIEN